MTNTYDINLVSAAASVTGTIVTNGATGVLSSSDIVDWNLVISVPGYGTIDLTGPNSGNNSAVIVVGNDLTATPTALFFKFQDQTVGNELYFDYPNYSTFKAAALDFAGLGSNPNPVVGGQGGAINIDGETPFWAIIPAPANDLIANLERGSTVSETITLSGSKPSVTVSGVATDTTSPLESVYINSGTTNLLGSNGDWTYTQTKMAAGTYDYVATIGDDAGNQWTATGSVVTINDNKDIVVAGTIGGDTVNSTVGSNNIAITDTSGGDNTVSTTGGHNQVSINDTTGQNSVTLSGGNDGIGISDSNGGGNKLSTDGGHDQVAITDTTGQNSVTLAGGNNGITVTDVNGGGNTVSTTGGHNQVALTDITGQDIITLAGGNNQLTIYGSAGGDNISASTNDNFVYKQMLSNYDTISGVFNSGGNTKDIFDLSAIAGAATYQGAITSGGQVNANSVGYAVVNGDTFIYVNNTGSPESLAAAGAAPAAGTVSPILELVGIGHLTAGNFHLA